MGLLMTATLLGSFKWMQEAPSIPIKGSALTWAEKAKEDFYKKIRRQDKFETSPEAERGKEFERIICDNCNGTTEEVFMNKMKEIYVDKINAHAVWKDRPSTEKERLLEYILNTCSTFYQLCKDGQQQVKVGKDIVVDGETFYLYGFIDVLQPTTILDLKTCANYKESKYRDSIQHTIYQYCTETLDFKYVVANYEGGDFPIDCRVVETSARNVEEVERKIKGRIHNLVVYLKNNNLWEDYLNLFCRGKK
jgi:hypothetical protein